MLADSIGFHPVTAAHMLMPEYAVTFAAGKNCFGIAELCLRRRSRRGRALLRGCLPPVGKIND